mmetsp:Transcript_12733/g.19712  ORF Transcript_12733/g.19712 Transcript_12733/m.19712 type:complete len:985 (-) Transcript_12733:112-3066(-)
MAETEEAGDAIPTKSTKYYDEPIEDDEAQEIDLEGPSERLSDRFIKVGSVSQEDGGDEICFSKTDYSNSGNVVRLRSKMKFNDHFSLPAPSNTVRFEKNDVTVYCMSGGTQIQVEDHGERSFLTRQVSDSSVGLTMLRFWYALVAFVMMGLLLAFTVQLLFNIFVSVMINSGLTQVGNGHPLNIIALLLSLPIWILGLSGAMSVATAFLVDTWRGNKFVKMFLDTKRVWVDWISFLIFLGIPVLTMIITLFARAKFWSITTMVWVSLAFAYYGFYAIAIIYYEVRACFELIRHVPNYQKRGKTTWPWMVLASIEFRLNSRFCGVERYHYLEKGHLSSQFSNNGSFETEDDVDKGKPKISLWSRFTMIKLWEKYGWFTKLEKPKRRFNIEEVEGGRPVVTSSTWELERFFLRNNNVQYATVISGPGALAQQQVRSSCVCTIVAMLLVFLLIASFVFYLGNMVLLVLITLLAFLLVTVIPRSIRLYKIAKFYNNAKEEIEAIKKEDKMTGKSTAFVEIVEKWEVNKINPKVGWFIFAGDFVFFFLIPLISLFVVKSTPTALIFLLVSFVSYVRYYLNPSHLIQSLGKLDEYMDDPNDEGEFGDWRDHHRVSFILKHITKGKNRDTWRRFFATFIFIFLVLFIAAWIQGVSEGMSVDSLDNSKGNYYWPRQEGVSYPTCNLEDAIFKETGLMDYTYMAYASSFEPDAMKDVLDTWFGENVARSRQDVIDEFKSQADDVVAKSPVTYRLLEFPSNDTSIRPDFYVVTIRGTSNIVDMISNLQLWTSATFVQVLRAIVPFGSILDTVYTEFIGAWTFIETPELKKIEVYKSTTEFVNWLREEKNYTNIHLTGHSLGGGIAMISGVQTKTPAYALSGPNAMLGRKTYDPPLDLDLIDQYSFNIVPDRDMIPRIDLVAHNSQGIRCLAPTYQPWACHRATRSLCEIMYRCGSEGRPIFCNCVLDYDYPEPARQFVDTSFREYCEEAKENGK